MNIRRFAVGGAVAVTSAALLTACGSQGGTKSTKAGADHAAVTVVASTNVWGDVVEQVAGDLAGPSVKVSSIIASPDADPHSYEANAQNQLALSKATLVVENGGGYDDFVNTMLKSADNDRATVLNAVDISGKKAPAHGELNEHVWYDFPTVQKVAARVQAALSKADPDHASTYRANEKAFDQKLDGMRATEAAIKSTFAGKGVAITEPVPLYLLEACGLVNKTPSEFSEAIEEGTDVPARVLKQTEDLFNDRQVALLAYNEQTSGPESEAVLKAAKANGIAVLPVTETLPAGKNYVSWMQGYLKALQSDLG